MAAPQAVARVSADETPEWLAVMRAMTGTVETPGDADNPKIMAMADEIARTYPEMADYCAQYNHDSVPWCGLTVAYCMTMAGIRPVFGPTDTDKFLWAQAWASDPDNYVQLASPRLGCIVVMTRSGGGHVTLYESTSGSNYVCRGGNQSDAINTQSFPINSVIALVWPSAAGPVPPVPPAERRELKKGDKGPDVAALQMSLGIPADGDFGSVTDSQVRGFQAACGLGIDGEVGPNTWAQVDALDARMAAGNSGLSKEVTDAIVTLAKGSPLMNYSWPDRGEAPAGYIPGMALSYAVAVSKQDNSAVQLMAQADTKNTDTDALAWYADQFDDHEMDNSEDGIDTLRHLFVLLIGLGMRESSGKYCEGRDMSASNVSADTAEAGLFQTSWNIRSASSEMQNIFNAYWNDPNGFLPQFCVGISPTSSNLQVFGTGAGASYQWLAKFSPAFAAMTTAVGLRTRRNHWGPINRYEVDLVDAVDDLLLGVQALIDAGPTPEPPEPAPEPVIATITITIDPPGSAHVVITGNA